MKKTIYTLIILTCFINSLSSNEYCFLAKENQKILKNEGDSKTRYAPESTFKIPLSLMGFDSGILIDENNPSWPYNEKYKANINIHIADHTPRTWMRDSCVWYSQVLTNLLGIEKFTAYIENFNYGNRDLSGDKGQNNGLTHAWLSSSLQISPEEQTAFIQSVVEQTLPISQNSYDKTKKIMFIQELPGGWKLYGKTGNGRQLDQEGNETHLQHGWFIGYIEKNQRSIVFASHLVDQETQSTPASFRARNETLIKLWYLINELEAPSLRD